MPRIKTTPMVRFALWCLRVYLLLLLTLICLKFIRIFSNSGKIEKPGTTAPANATAAPRPSP